MDSGASRTPNGKNSLGVKASLALLRSYKVYVSPWFAGSCRFEPTCSAYAYQAIERFGVRRGSWLALKRLLRCQPLSRKFGYDPVPDAGGISGTSCGVAAHDTNRANAYPSEAHQ